MQVSTWSREGGEGISPAILTLEPFKLGLGAFDLIPVSVTIHNSQLAELSARDTKFILSVIEPRGTTATFIHDLHDWLLDAFASKLLVGDESDLMLVHPSRTGGVWICVICRDSDQWHCAALDIDRPTPISTNYALPENLEQSEDLLATHLLFMGFAGQRLLGKMNRVDSRLIRIKVHCNEHWFLRFPLGIFTKFHLRGFENYSGCQWIVTERTISAVSAAQAETERELSNTGAFLAGAYIVLNTYKRHNASVEAGTVNAGFDLLVELLTCFNDIRIRDQEFKLKWTMNPSTDQLYSILTSKATRFFFADFEADGGIWTVGDGVHSCGTSCKHELSSASGHDRFDLARMRGTLEHIRLMRVFHCNSIFDPYRNGTQPADPGTIAAALLATQAFFVEGSVTAEPVIDFICTMLTLLLGRNDLRAILFAQSLKGECDISSLIARANMLLNQRGFSSI